MANPTLLTSPIAENGDKNVIPASTGATTGLLDQEHGFQQINELPLQTGGLPPQRKDFNGVFNLLSGILYMTQRGYTFEYDNTLPYVTGCIVIDPLDGKTYRCINDVPAGSTNPSTDMTNWMHYDCVPSSGGSVLDGNEWRRNTDDDYILLSGGSGNEGGATILLNGKNRSDNEGIIEVYALTDTKSASFTLTPDGRFDVNPDVINTPTRNDDLAGSAIVAKSFGTQGYVKRASGEIVQWTAGQIVPGNTEGNVTFPISFTTTARVSVTSISGAGINVAVKGDNVSLTGFTAQSSATSGNYIYFHVIAIGY